MFQRLFSLAQNTFIETIRQPIYGVILITTTFLMILNVSLAGFTMDDNKLLLDLGLSTLMLSGLFLSAFSATGVISREIENKTVLTVISKPVSRPVFILGKFGGLLAALTVAYYLCVLVFILTERHGVLENSSDPWDAPVLALGFGSILLALIASAFCNYFYGWDFPSTTIGLLVPLLTISVLLVGKLDEHWETIPFGSNFVGGQVILAAYLVLLIVVVTSAVALAASTRFGQLMTLVICTGVLGLGIVSDYAFGRHEETSQLAGIAYHLIPNVGPFWVIDGLTAEMEETTVTVAYLGYVTAYAALITTAMVSLAIVMFQKRELG
ncbi:MAG: ABC transporter permease [Planctomycetes bacterium]|nr:ABC transporter permease [Planctomycetota bacterium]